MRISRARCKHSNGIIHNSMDSNTCLVVSQLNVRNKNHCGAQSVVLSNLSFSYYKIGVPQTEQWGVLYAI